MKTSNEMFQKVAEYCSEYNPKTPTESFCNLYSEDLYSDHARPACTNCKHFKLDEECNLALYDKIVQNHNIKD